MHRITCYQSARINIRGHAGRCVYVVHLSARFITIWGKHIYIICFYVKVQPHSFFAFFFSGTRPFNSSKWRMISFIDLPFCITHKNPLQTTSYERRTQYTQIYYGLYANKPPPFKPLQQHQSADPIFDHSLLHKEPEAHLYPLSLSLSFWNP